VSGKLDDKVYVNSKKYGYHIRKAAAAGIKQHEPSLVAQYSRTRFLNALASELNMVMNTHFPHFKGADFYHRVQKCFRQEPLNRRFLLLLQLKGLELNAGYPIGELGGYRLQTEVAQQDLLIQLEAVHHPLPGRHKADSYFYEVLALFWDKKGGAVVTDWQLSEWIPIGGGRPGFDFRFALPRGTVHWLVCLRQQLGAKGKDLDFFPAQGVQIADAGSFDKQDLDIVAQRAVKPEEQPPVKAPPEMERVKARRFLQ
jgi:hypothetical protein